LYEKYHSKGFEVLGFPCNQFGGQEPGTEGEIKTFCETSFGIKFPLFSKIDVLFSLIMTNIIFSLFISTVICKKT
jgi:glutathione peroxidase-family protein